MARQVQTVRTRQAGLPQSVHFGRFDGIHNNSARVDLKPTELYRAVNMDIDRAGLLGLRQGQTLRYALDGAHSLDPSGSGLFVLGGNLMLMNNDFATATIIRPNVGDNHMNYAHAPRGSESIYDDAVFYTNGSIIGYYQNGTVYNLTAQNLNYKSEPLPGQAICFFNDTLIVGRGNMIQVSDATKYMTVDQRYGIQYLPGTIRMILPVDDGLWISDDEQIYFFRGNDPSNFKRDISIEVPAIPGSWAEVDRRMFGKRKEDISGTNIMGRTWMLYTERGVYWVTKNGQFGNITGRKYDGPKGYQAAAVYRPGEINQYICSVL